MWALQQRAESEPLPRAIESICALRVAVALPGVRSYRAAQLRRTLVERDKVPRNYVQAAAITLCGKNISLFANGVAAQNAFRSRLALGAVEVIVGSHIADEREVFCPPEAFREENGVLDDPRILQLFGGCQLRGGKRWIKAYLLEDARRDGADAGVCAESLSFCPDCNPPGALAYLFYLSARAYIIWTDAPSQFVDETRISARHLE